MELGEKIKKLREEKKMSQEELAKAVGTTRQNICKYEKGHINNVTVDMVRSLALALNTSPSALSGWDEKYSDTSLAVDLVKKSSRLQTIVIKLASSPARTSAVEVLLGIGPEEK